MQTATLVRDHSHAVRPAEVPAPVAEVRRGQRNGIVWGALGFCAGAIFWHAVGFWGFVSDAVLAGASDTELVRVADARAQLQPGESPTIHLIDPRKCTALELDRGTNRTAVRPCPSDGLSLRLEPGRTRADMAALAP